MAVDREAALKRAEKLLRQGKLEDAIAEYVRLVESHPRDWNSINALGDLFVRAGDVERAVAQFTRVADHLFTEGFLPKAAALYKKSLKVDARHEHTLARLSEVAAQQGLLADAKAYLRQLSSIRRERGDAAGAAECLVSLATLDESDADGRVTAAAAVHALGDAARAAALYREAAEAFEKQQRNGEALDALIEASRLQPSDSDLRRSLARRCVDAGELDRARLVLDAESAGDDPDLLLALARLELEQDHDAEARAALTRLVLVAPDREDAVLQLAAELAAAGRPEPAYQCVELVADAALLRSDFERAASALERFLERGAYLPALVKLVEVCVDAGLDARMRSAQARLADACLDAGRSAEARVIAEDLVANEPGNAGHVERLRRALTALGVADAEEVIARLLGADSPEAPDVIDLGDGLEPEAGSSALQSAAAESASPPEPAAPAEALDADDPAALETSAPSRDDERIVLEPLEVDLSEQLATLHRANGTAPEVRPAAVSPSTGPSGREQVEPVQDLDAVFQQMRSRAAVEHGVPGTIEQFDRAQRLLLEGRASKAIEELQAVARAPMLRFAASAQLGRLHVERGDVDLGIEWLERAAEAPAPTPEEGVAVLYDLASALERMGESARALAVLLEIEALAGGYRDVRDRVERLTRAQAGSREA